MRLQFQILYTYSVSMTFLRNWFCFEVTTECCWILEREKGREMLAVYRKKCIYCSNSWSKRNKQLNIVKRFASLLPQTNDSRVSILLILFGAVKYKIDLMTVNQRKEIKKCKLYSKQKKNEKYEMCAYCDWDVYVPRVLCPYCRWDSTLWIYFPLVWPITHWSQRKYLVFFPLQHFYFILFLVSFFIIAHVRTTIWEKKRNR